LQVEHPVTELVAGVDLVKAQILTAADEPVFSESEFRAPRGHAIECRIYAEDPEQGGIPSTGILGHVSWPEGPGRRFDYGFEEGDKITPFYDSMIAKAIVWDFSRNSAIQKMLKVLDECVIFGVRTNIPLLKKIISHPEFISGKMTTRFMETHFPGALKMSALSPAGTELFKAALRETPKTASASSISTVSLNSAQSSSGQSLVFAQPWRAL
jgi:acetyl/propionyl-CoA carboxylase alpha subunit